VGGALLVDGSILEPAAHHTAALPRTARIFPNYLQNRLGLVRLVSENLDPLLGSGPQCEIAEGVRGTCWGDNGGISDSAIVCQAVKARVRANDNLGASARNGGARMSRFGHYVARPLLTIAPMMFGAGLALAIAVGWINRDQDYLVPEGELGYGLIIAGAVLMLLLLLCPLRESVGAAEIWIGGLLAAVKPAASAPTTSTAAAPKVASGAIAPAPSITSSCATPVAAALVATAMAPIRANAYRRRQAVIEIGAQ